MADSQHDAFWDFGPERQPVSLSAEWLPEGSILLAQILDRYYAIGSVLAEYEIGEIGRHDRLRSKENRRLSQILRIAHLDTASDHTVQGAQTSTAPCGWHALVAGGRGVPEESAP